MVQALHVEAHSFGVSPAMHCVHLEAPESATDPASQAVQTLLPAAPANEPREQGTHCSAPAWTDTCPAGQGAQAPRLSPFVPRGQGSHTVLLDRPVLPLSQVVQRPPSTETVV